MAGPAGALGWRHGGGAYDGEPRSARARGAAREITVERRMSEVRRARHCRHCAGDGSGECMLGDGQCIHGWNGKRPVPLTWQVLLSRRWWRRVMWGEGADWRR